MDLKQKIKISDIEDIFGDKKSGMEDFFNEFSVLLPVVEKDGELHVLYELRARHMDVQPGEICFPGGKIEQGESPKDCALRETWEEVGIPQDKIKVIAQLDMMVNYSNVAMYAYLGIVDECALDEMKLNPDEVEEVFLVPFEWLLENEPEIYWTKVAPQPPEDFPYDKVTGGEPYKWRHGKAPVPVYPEFGDKVIWGFTGRITKRFVDTIKGGRVDV
ncbi:MAG: CoA pyrophosphatase [Bacillota bacterium]|nr:CoA pyrophosphatase [Bacillota bacterium]